MNSTIILFVLLGYLVILLIVSRLTSGGTYQSFFNGNRQSHWFLVAFGVIGATLSGVTFISVPGLVGKSGFSYLQFVMGNVVGYWIIAFFLLPFYYKKNVVSIYSVLNERFGRAGYLTASGFFILSKLISSAFRLYLAATVIHLVVSQEYQISFEITVLVCLIAIWLYTYKGGIKTIVWTDTIQTVVLLLAVVFSIFSMMKQLGGFNLDIINQLKSSSFVRVLNFDVNSGNYFFKQFISGIVVTLAINGFDQDIVQKNLTCRSASQARKNMLWFSLWFLITVFLFLLLGVLLYQFAFVKSIQLPIKGDEVFPFLALNHLGVMVALMFVVGISAAAFSSADSAITALTTAFCVDFLGGSSDDQFNSRKSTRNWVHLGFTVLILVVIVFFKRMNNQSVVDAIFKAAGYTYGPILGLFLFAFFIKSRQVNTQLILPLAILSPALTYLLTLLFNFLIPSYQFGFELIVFNTLFMLGLLIFVSKSSRKVKKL